MFVSVGDARCLSLWVTLWVKLAVNPGWLLPVFLVLMLVITMMTHS